MKTSHEQNIPTELVNSGINEFQYIFPFMEEKERVEKEKRKIELGIRACEIIEEVISRSEKLMIGTEPRIIGAAIGEMMKDVVEEYRSLLDNK